MGRGVWRAIFGQPPKPNRPLLEGRLLYSFGLKAEDADVPNSVVRAEDEIGVPRRGDRRLEAGLPPQLLARLTQVLTYSTAARGGPGGAASAHAPHRKPKKPKLLPSSSHALAMRPLPTRAATAPAAALAAAPPAFADADALPTRAATGPAAAPAAQACGHPARPLRRPGRRPSAAAPTAAASAAPAAGKKAPVVDDDDGDIFGDVGSDYVCKPTTEQEKAARRDKRDAAALRSAGYLTAAPPTTPTPLTTRRPPRSRRARRARRRMRCWRT